MADLITLKEYKDFIGSTSTKEDPKIKLIIASVSNLIKAYIHMPLGDSDEVTEAISVDYDTDTIFLNSWPITGIISVTELDRYTLDSTIHVPLYAGADYQVFGDKIVRIPGKMGFSRWPVGPNTVVVTYTVGFDSEDTPDDLKLAAIEMVRYYSNEEYKQSRTIMGTTVVNTISKDTAFPAHVQRILDNYK